MFVLQLIGCHIFEFGLYSNSNVHIINCLRQNSDARDISFNKRSRDASLNGQKTHGLQSSQIQSDCPSGSIIVSPYGICRDLASQLPASSAWGSACCRLPDSVESHDETREMWACSVCAGAGAWAKGCAGHGMETWKRHYAVVLMASLISLPLPEFSLMLAIIWQHWLAHTLPPHMLPPTCCSVRGGTCWAVSNCCCWKVQGRWPTEPAELLQHSLC